MVADEGCEKDVVQRMNERYRAWGTPKCVLSKRGLVIKAKKCLYEGVILPTAFSDQRGLGYEKCCET